MEKTFADIRVGHKLYWGTVGMDHIGDTIVTDTHLNLDGEHLPNACEVTFETNDSFKFGICNLLLKMHNCVIFTHKITGNEIYIGTTKEAVANQILKTLDSKISFWTQMSCCMIIVVWKISKRMISICPLWSWKSWTSSRREMSRSITVRTSVGFTDR